MITQWDLGNQPHSETNKHQRIWDLVHKDMKEREDFGNQTHSKPLLPFDGRDALKECYEEALDLVVYLRQVIFERDGR